MWNKCKAPNMKCEYWGCKNKALIFYEDRCVCFKHYNHWWPDVIFEKV